MAKKILIVDDSFEDLEIMKKALEKEKYGVETATNGAQAIDLAYNEKFDMIIIDIMMPTLSGYDILRLLREKFDGKCKMLYVSVVPKKNVDMTHADGFIQKPFTNKSFVTEVKKVLK